MKLKKRLTNKIGFDPTITTLLATGMAGLAVATRDDAPPQAPTAQTPSPPIDAPVPDNPPFADPILPPPPAHEPGQRSVFHQQEAEHLLVADLLPPVETATPIDWQVMPPIASEPVAEHPQALALQDKVQEKMQAPPIQETPPPPLQDNEEDMSSDPMEDFTASPPDII